MVSAIANDLGSRLVAAWVTQSTQPSISASTVSIRSSALVCESVLGAIRAPDSKAFWMLPISEGSNPSESSTILVLSIVISLA